MKRQNSYINSVRLCAIGIGGGGIHALDYMAQSGLHGVEFVAVDADRRALASSVASNCMSIGGRLTHGYGAGGNPTIGMLAAREAGQALRGLLADIDMLFMLVSLGGGIGSGAAPIIAHLAQELGILTVAFVTRPFNFESRKRERIAKAGIVQLKQFADTFVVIPPDRFNPAVDVSPDPLQVGRRVHAFLYQQVQIVSDLITKPGLINLDFADIRAILEKQKTLLITNGVARGEDRAFVAAQEATACPMLDKTITGAQNVLTNIVASPDWNLWEMEQATSIIASEISPDAGLLFGTTIENAWQDKVQISVIATGFPDRPSTQMSAERSPGYRLESTLKTARRQGVYTRRRHFSYRPMIKW